jgi:hypothetical protein
LGTSSSYSSPTTLPWKRAKNATSRFASGGGEAGGRSPALPIARFVQALGGAREAAREAPVGRAVANRLLAFGQATAQRGIDAALREFGLEDAVGLAADEALQRIVDTLAAGANTLDETAAREALVDVIRELLEDSDDVEDAFGDLDVVGALDLLRRFIAAYIFRRFAKALGDRLRAHAESAPAARRREEEMKRYIAAEVVIAFEDIDVETLDWRNDTERIIERCMREAFRTLGDEDA